MPQIRNNTGMTTSFIIHHLTMMRIFNMYFIKHEFSVLLLIYAPYRFSAPVTEKRFRPNGIKHV